MTRKILCYILLINLIKLTDAAREVKGFHVVDVQNSGTAKFKWTFNFPMSDVYGMKIDHIKLDGTLNVPSIAFYRGGRVVNGVNKQFTGRISASLPTAGINLDISSVSINDQGNYRVIVDMKDFGVSPTNITELVVKVPPTIDKRFTSLEKTERDFASLLCVTTAGNPKPMDFQWFKKNKKGVFEAKTSVVKQDVRYDYNITSVDRDSRGDYKCIVTNSGGQDMHEINLRVRYTPVVMFPPINRSVFQDIGTTELNCQADGNPEVQSYHWYVSSPLPVNEIKQNTAVIKIENNGKRLKFIKPGRNDATFYYCAGQNTLGTGEAKGAFLNVTYKPGDLFIENERNGIVNGNQKSNFTVKCSSDANPPAVYTWYRKVRNWRGEYEETPIVLNSFSGHLDLFNVSTNDTGDYICVAENRPNRELPNQKFAARKEIQIIIRFGPKFTNLTVNGTIYKSVEIREGDPAEIRCNTFSEPAANYEIKLKSRGPQLLNKDQKVGYYRIEKMSQSDEGIYECIASNTVLKTEEKREVNVILSIPPVMIPPIPNGREVREGATVSMECHAEGKPAPKVYWQKYGENITKTDPIITKEYKVVLPGLKTRITAKLIFNGIRYTDTGGYSCILYNAVGNKNMTATFTVQYAPKITKRPENLTVRDGDDKKVRFVCEAIAHPDVTSWQWFFNGVLTSEASNTFIRGIPDRHDNGVYTCRSRNTIGFSDNATAYLQVEYKPFITDISKDKTVDISERVELYCDANGVPDPVIKWTNSLDPKFSYVGKSLIFQSVTPENKGLYSCSASNVVGDDTKTLKLFVRHPPIITSNTPAETKIGVAVGMPAILTCVVNAVPQATITWSVIGETSLLQDGARGYTIIDTFGNFGGSSRLSVTATENHLGKNYLCKAKNSFGEDEQEFQILRRGKPEKPVSMTFSDVLQPTVPVTVNITIDWIPGFDGGYPVEYILLYKEESEVAFQENFIGTQAGNTYVFQNRKAGTTYVFSMKAKNERGYSTEMEQKIFATKPAPPDVAVVEFQKHGTEGTSILVLWSITKQPGARKKRNTPVTWDFGIIKYRKHFLETIYTQKKILNIDTNGTYPIDNLSADDLYEFQFILYDTNGGFANPVVQQLYPGEVPTAQERSGLSKTDIIAVAVGCGGAFLLIAVIILFVIFNRKKDSKKAKYKTHYNNGRVQVDIPVSTMNSQYSTNAVRASYLNDEDPFAADSSVIDDDYDKSPPPDYDNIHYNSPPDRPGQDYGDHPNSTFRPAPETTPSYTSFGRLPKKQQDDLQSKSMTSLNGQRATEISRRNDMRHSMDALDDSPERNPRDDDLPVPPPFMRDAIRYAPSDEGGLNNRVPGAFDRTGRFKKPSPRVHDDGPPSQPAPPPNGFHQSGRQSPPSIASSKPYRSDNDNEYIDDADQNYVGYLV